MSKKHVVLEVLKMLEKVMEKEAKIKFVRDRLAYDRNNCMTTNKLKYEVTQ